MGELGATCVRTLSDETRDMDKAQWDVERFGMVCTDRTNFASWKKAILKLCRKNPLCDFETRAALDAFYGRIQAIRFQ